MKTYLAVCGMGLLAAALSFGLVGCEVQSADTKVTIDPNSATVGMGDSVTFTASGGYDYRWSLSDPSLGTLSTIYGDSTIYTSLFESSSSNTAVQVLTVSSSIDGSATSNSLPAEWTAEVYINHI